MSDLHAVRSWCFEGVPGLKLRRLYPVHQLHEPFLRLIRIIIYHMQPVDLDSYYNYTANGSGQMHPPIKI